MRLLELTLTDVGGAPNGAYRFQRGADDPAPVTLVTGAGPTGKTSLLEAIVAAKELAGAYSAPPAPSSLLRPGATRGLLAARWLFDEGERALIDATPPNGHAHGDDEQDEPPPPVEPTATIGFELRPDSPAAPPARHGIAFSRYDRSPAVAKVEYFADDRRMRPLFWTEPVGPLRDRLEAAARLVRALPKYGFVRRFVGDLHASTTQALAARLTTQGVITQVDELDALAPLKRGLAALAPELRFARIELAEGSARIFFERAGGGEVELDELSSTQHQAMLFATAYLRQGLDRSLVLVDRPELDVPRAHALDFFKALVALAPAAQLIAATDSPEIIAGMPDANVIDLSTR
jgi:predicted ATPase